MIRSVSNLKKTDLNRTLIIIKRNEEEKQKDTSIGKQVIDEALALSSDLTHKEMSDCEGHEDFVSPIIKKEIVYKKEV